MHICYWNDDKICLLVWYCWRQPPFTRFYIWQLIESSHSVKWISLINKNLFLQVQIQYEWIWLMSEWLQISVSWNLVVIYLIHHQMISQMRIPDSCWRVEDNDFNIIRQCKHDKPSLTVLIFQVLNQVTYLPTWKGCFIYRNKCSIVVNDYHLMHKLESIEENPFCD